MSPRNCSRPDCRTLWLRYGARFVAVVGVATVLAGGLAVPASAKSDRQHPNNSAKHVGVTANGGGYAGWAMRSEAGHHTEVQPKKVSGIRGIDVSGYQGDVDWTSWWNKGKRFAYSKATEGTSYRNPHFSQQYTGSYNAGMYHGAYHFARPDGASGKAQANYFVAHGGDWSADGKTLPGMLDLEDNYTGGDRCYGQTPSQMKAWVRSFVHRYQAKTSRDPVIYTNASFWRSCMGDTTAFHTISPLNIAAWSSTPPASLPGGWPYYTFWQYSGWGAPEPGTDQDTFNGSKASLKKLATD